MISSMTGYGRGEVSKNRTTVAVEIRTVNSRYMEVNLRMPGSLALRENEIKDAVRKGLARGKVNISISVSRANGDEPPVRVNPQAAKSYHALLSSLKKSLRLGGEITLDHLLKFPEVLEADGFDDADETEWALTQQAVAKAVEQTAKMRMKEGAELRKDLLARLKLIEKRISDIEKRGAMRVPEARDRMRRRLTELLEDRAALDDKRLELELALYADRLDMTEESVRFRSHVTFFRKAIDEEESPGRKLNFLVQEMNREVNTMGSKANDAAIAQTVVEVKEELEKIREQLQNIE